MEPTNDPVLPVRNPEVEVSRFTRGGRDGKGRTSIAPEGHYECQAKIWNDPVLAAEVERGILALNLALRRGATAADIAGICSDDGPSVLGYVSKMLWVRMTRGRKTELPRSVPFAQRIEL